MLRVAIPDFQSIKATSLPARRRPYIAFDILRVLADSDCTNRKLQEEIDANQSSIDYALRRLLRAGLVEKAGFAKPMGSRPAVIWRLALRLRGTA